jgi:hypothetical protein
MATGLNVADFVAVSVVIEPIASQYRNFGIGLVLGSTSGVIDTAERLRLYTSLSGIAQDFGTTAPEYLAAKDYFSQSPQPAVLYVGRWAQTATKGHIRGASLSPTQRLLTNFTMAAGVPLTNGSLSVSIDGTPRNITGINLSSATNLNGVAQIIQTALAAVVPNAVVKWDAVYNRFDIASGTTGPGSSVGYATTAPSGTDLGPLLHLTSADASAPVPGIAAESLASAVATLADASGAWYSLQVATATPPADADHIAVAALIEGLSTSQSRIYGATLTNANVIDSTTNADLASSFKTGNYSRTYSQFSRNDPYAAESLFGRFATVDYEGSNTTITGAYKQEPGVAAEVLAESQFGAIKAKNTNVFVAVNNGTNIIMPAVMANGDYIDERIGADWMQNRIQTDCYNLLYTTPTKVPQTDAGMNRIKAVITKACAVAVANGFIGAGTGQLWRGPPVGTLNTGDPLPAGFYIFAPSVSTQSQADRAARRSVPFQVCCTLSGAVHIISVSALLDR